METVSKPRKDRHTQELCRQVLDLHGSGPLSNTAALGQDTATTANAAGRSLFPLGGPNPRDNKAVLVQL